MTRPSHILGIDPGVHTGLAMYSRDERKLISLLTGTAVEIEMFVLEWTQDQVEGSFHVYVEDTRGLRLPKALQNQGRLKGAGSVHRDMGRWEEFLQHHKVPYTMCGLSPKMFRESTDASFRKMTGWTGARTNEHQRAAAGLVWGR